MALVLWYFFLHATVQRRVGILDTCLQRKYSLRKGQGVGVMDKPPHSSQRGEWEGGRKEISLLKNHEQCQMATISRSECLL